MRSYQTKRISSIRRVLKFFPVLGGLWLAGAVAITGAPPFALFLSELAIIRSGLAASQNILIGLMAVLLIVIFVGFVNQFRIMYFEDGESNDPDVRAVTPWMIAPMGLAIVPLLIMGLWWPQAFWDDFQTIALSLGASTVAGPAP
jgi:hydrogenase-4 component F